MPLLLFGIFLLVPILEIAAFIQINSLIGLLPTLGGIVVTAVIGAWLVRLQGFKVLREAQAAQQRQEVPVDAAIHGVFILFAGLLLLTPGYLTDAMGFALLVPSIRRFIARNGWRWIKARMSVVVQTSGQPHRGPAGGQVIDGEAVDVTDTARKPDPNSPWLENGRRRD